MRGRAHPRHARVLAGAPRFARSPVSRAVQNIVLEERVVRCHPIKGEELKQLVKWGVRTVS